MYGGTGLLVLFALPLCLWLTLRYSLAVPACIEEGLGTLRSLKRSVFLTQDTKGRILVLSADRDGCPGHIGDARS